MSKKKGKFDLTQLVHDGCIKDGEILYFVSNPNLSCKVKKQPNNEYKIETSDGITTIHAFAQKCLGTEPPDHASRWFRNEKNETLYQLWKAGEDEQYAA